MYDSFSSIVMCPCGHGENDDDIQSKDFGCMLDHFKQGESTDKAGFEGTGNFKCRPYHANRDR